MNRINGKQWKKRCQKAVFKDPHHTSIQYICKADKAGGDFRRKALPAEDYCGNESIICDTGVLQP
jgi:hypothetical protein